MKKDEEYVEEILSWLRKYRASNSSEYYEQYTYKELMGFRHVTVTELLEKKS